MYDSTMATCCYMLIKSVRYHLLALDSQLVTETGLHHFDDHNCCLQVIVSYNSCGKQFKVPPTQWSYNFLSKHNHSAKAKIVAMFQKYQNTIYI